MNSKCTTCKWGLCFLEEEQHTIFPSDESEDKEAGFGFEDNVIHDEIEHITARREQGVCFWVPDGIQKGVFPVKVSRVLECNRYESR